ncbi:hypothetical protein [Mongoliimonas terrestris]|uniref:hypothetical protein n=1 Tax=Mongoliimonas terrestris TaxID=1709001 RepID=UPI0009495159|nr:hypothetical protein [Mongoliimonas terrestris]
MKHESLDQIRVKADVTPAVPLTQRQRLERWAALLEKADGPMAPLYRIEYLTPEERLKARGDHTPLAVAFADPDLRADGLKSDRLGDVMAYFGLNAHEAHHMLCDCHYHGTMTGAGVAKRLRSKARFSDPAPLWAFVRSIFGLRRS